jgi:hypothetical protein
LTSSHRTRVAFASRYPNHLCIRQTVLSPEP